MYHKNPTVAPIKAAANTTSSSAPGMNMIFRKEANSKCDDIYASIPSATPIIAELPAARPSRPSVRFAPFDTAVTTKITIRTKTSQAASSLYLKAAKEGADYTAAADLSELFLESGASVDFLYLHDYRRPEFVEEVFRICADRTAQTSVFVIEGIRYTSRMRAVWKRISRHEKAGITFDLYDLGIIFFDKTRIKQDYIVNF